MIRSFLSFQRVILILTIDYSFLNTGKQMENSLTEAIADKEKLFADLQAETDRLIATEDKLLQTQTLKDKLEASLNEALEKLESEEHSSEVLEGKVAEAESKIDELNNKADEMSTNIHRVSTALLNFLQRV